MSAADNYYDRSLGVSSPIWTSEASLARTREQAAKQSRLLSRERACERRSSRVSSPVPLAHVLFARYPPNGELARRLLLQWTSLQRRPRDWQNIFAITALH